MSKKYNPSNEIQRLCGGMVVRPLMEVPNSVVVAAPLDIHVDAACAGSIQPITDWLCSLRLDPYHITMMRLFPCVHIQFDSKEAAAEALQVFAQHGVEIVDWPAAVMGVAICATAL
jgi:hypothetical protein